MKLTPGTALGPVKVTCQSGMPIKPSDGVKGILTLRATQHYNNVHKGKYTPKRTQTVSITVDWQRPAL